MKKFKQSFIPLGVMVLSAVAAFATQGTSGSNFAPEAGYITTNPNMPCAELVECDNSGGPACTVLVGGVLHTAYGKVNPSDAWCTKPLFQKRIN